MSWAKCSLCGQVFTSVSGFDAHQTRQFGQTPPIFCIDPRTLGMEQNQAGRWHFPETAASRAHLAKMRAEQASARVTGRGQG